MRRPFDDPYEEPATEPDLREECAECGRELWWDGLPPIPHGNRLICNECDAAHGHDTVD